MGCILLQYLQKGNNNNHFAVKPTTRREDFSLSPHTRDNLCKPMLCSVHSTAQSHYKILCTQTRHVHPVMGFPGLADVKKEYQKGLSHVIFQRQF